MNTNTTNTTTNNTNTNMKERIMNKIHSIKNGIIEIFMNEKKFDVFATINICFFVALLLFLAFAGRGGIIDGSLVCIAIWRILYYFINTKKSGKKRSVKDFMKAIYTQDDFEELRQDIFKEMKIRSDTEISSMRKYMEDMCEDEIEIREKMKNTQEKWFMMNRFLHKFYVEDPFNEEEEDCLASIAVWLMDKKERACLKDVVDFFDSNDRKFISTMHDITESFFDDGSTVSELTNFMLNKKELKDFRKKIHTVFDNHKEARLAGCYVENGAVLDSYNI